jgi:hypothetical protein
LFLAVFWKNEAVLSLGSQATDLRLRKTYNPVNVASVRRFDEARVAVAKKLEQKPDESVRAPVILTLFKKAGGVK